MRLLRAWDLREPVQVRPVTAGTNNTSYYLGDDFVLRIHKNKGFLEYEHAVLRAVRGLSFRSTGACADCGRAIRGGG